jgi:hypothetical protein
LKDPTSNAALIERYDAVPYEGQSNALSHPDTMAAVARLHGLEPPPIARCRVLEVGCSEGANLCQWRRPCQPRGGPPSRSVEALLLEACISGVVEAHVWTPALVCDAGERPLASPVARWQARNGEQITNLRHETLTLKDVSARRLLALLDGTRTRETLAKAPGEALAGDLPGALIAGADLDDYLNQFAKHALLLG